jgi:uncharacterized RDD family membrane protein YckC
LSARTKEQTGFSERKRTAQVLPEFAASLFLMILIWLFAELIFLPLSAESLAKNLSERVTSIVATAFILAIGYLLPQTVHKGEAVVKLLSNVLAKGRYTKANQPKMQEVFESLGRAVLSALLGVIISSLLYWIHPVFGGMTLLGTIIITFVFVFEGANHFAQRSRLTHSRNRSWNHPNFEETHHHCLLCNLLK